MAQWLDQRTRYKKENQQLQFEKIPSQRRKARKVRNISKDSNSVKINRMRQPTREEEMER